SVEFRVLRSGWRSAHAKLRAREYCTHEFRGLGRCAGKPHPLSIYERAVARQYPHSRCGDAFGGGGWKAYSALTAKRRWSSNFVGICATPRHMQSEKEQVALSSIFASAGLTVAKAVVGVATGSLAILSEAGHSLIDLGATVMTYVAVRISGKPADAKHQYGHGKVEALSALAETALLFLLSGIVGWEATKRLVEHEAHVVEATVWAFAVIIVSIIVDYFRARALSQTAEKTSSHALEADALHFSSDLWSSLAVLVGLIGVRFGLPWADSAAALAVALLVCVAGWRLGRRNIDMTVAVSRTLPLDRVRAIKDSIGKALRQQIPGAEPVITTDPVALNTETVLDRIMVIARNRALAVHHVTVHELKDKLAVSLDLEVDGRLTLQAAHDLADTLEAAIAAELGHDVEVETHIEPLQPPDASGREAPAERAKTIALT